MLSYYLPVINIDIYIDKNFNNFKLLFYFIDKLLLNASCHLKDQHKNITGCKAYSISN